MSNLKSKETDLLFEAILKLKSIEECYNFFEDACTIKEVKEIALRFKAAGMLYDKKSYNEVAEKTGVSTATICRVSKALNYGAGGYKSVIDRLKAEGKIKWA